MDEYNIQENNITKLLYFLIKNNVIFIGDLAIDIIDSKVHKKKSNSKSNIKFNLIYAYKGDTEKKNFKKKLEILDKNISIIEIGYVQDLIESAYILKYNNSEICIIYLQNMKENGTIYEYSDEIITLDKKRGNIKNWCY